MCCAVVTSDISWQCFTNNDLVLGHPVTLFEDGVDASTEYIYILESLSELCFYPRSVVKYKPPRKASAENLGTFMPTCYFSLIFISYIYILQRRRGI